MQDSSADKPRTETSGEEETSFRPCADDGAVAPESNDVPEEEPDSRNGSGDDGETSGSDVPDDKEPSTGGAGAAPTREEYDGLNDKYMRALAEAENIRRRADRDMREAARFRSTALARDLLPIHDYLKGALSSINKENGDAAPAGVIEGIELTLREFLKAFSRHGVEIVAPEAGDPFDSKLHEAMFQVPANDVPAGNIVSVMTEGFTIHDRLLRPAQVSVSSGPSAGSCEAGTETAGEE